MVISYPSNPKTLHPLQALSMKSSSSSTLTYMKIKTLIHTFIISHMCRVIRAISKAKSIIIEVLRDNQPIHFIYPSKKNKKYKTKFFFGSFRLHYNWCSSHVMPVPAPVLDEISSTHLYYDSTWNSIISTDQSEDHHGPESELSGYLHWLEEKENSANENIDHLADIFIANCHEKFRLEKQESYRRFQEMLARSM